MAELESTETNFEADLEQMLQETTAQIEETGDDDIIEELLADEAEPSDMAMTEEEQGDLVDSLLKDTEETSDAPIESPSSSMNEEDINKLLDGSDDSIELEVDDFGSDEEISAVEEATPEPEPDLSLSEELSSAENPKLDDALEDLSFDNIEGMDEVDDMDDMDDMDDASSSFELSEEEDEFDIPTSQPDTTQVIPETNALAMDDMNEQSERIRLLENEVTELRRRGDNASEIEEIESHVKKSKQDAQEGFKKLKVWIYSALGVAILAVILACLGFFFNSAVEEDVVQLESSLLDIEDKMAVPLLNPNDRKITDIQAQMQGLKVTVDKALKEADLFNVSQKQMSGSNLNAQKESLVLLAKKIMQLEQELGQIKNNKVARKVTRKSKPKRVVKVTKKRPTRKAVKKVEWVVNLAAFKQRWYTDKKVEDFKSKGIRAEVFVIDLEGVDWFRIRVTGFKNKVEARNYANKVKLVLNLSSVWVAKK